MAVGRASEAQRPASRIDQQAPGGLHNGKAKPLDPKHYHASHLHYNVALPSAGESRQVPSDLPLASRKPARVSDCNVEPAAEGLTSKPWANSPTHEVASQRQNGSTNHGSYSLQQRTPRTETDDLMAKTPYHPGRSESRPDRNGSTDDTDSVQAAEDSHGTSNHPPCRFPALGGSSNNSLIHSQSIDVDTKQLQRFCESTRVGLTSTLEAAWAILLQGYTLSSDVCFGCSSDTNLSDHYSNNDTDPQVWVRCVTLRSHETFADLLHHLHNTARNRVSQTSTQPKHAASNNHRQFNTSVIIQHSSKSTIHNGINGHTRGNSHIVLEHDVRLVADISSGEILLHIEYGSSMLSKADAERLVRSLSRIITTITEASQTSITNFSIVSMHDIRQSCTGQNVPPRTESCTHWLINAQIQQRPNDEAVVSWDGTLTYSELGSRAYALARRLSNLGVGPGTFVAICFPKSLSAVLTIVAVQMVGAAFVPLDPKAPPARWRDILDSVNAKIALCGQEFEDLLRGHVWKIVVIDERQNPSGDTREPLLVDLAPEDPSCVLFTSGSTGKPKGILMEHQTICSLSNGHGAHLKVGPGSRVFQFSAYTFDAGITDVLITLMRGGCVCVPSEHERLNDLAGAMTRLRANWVFLTPTIADLLSPADVPHLKRLVLGGEVTSPQLAARWKDAVELHSVYGPTEASICAINDNVGRAAQSTSIGKPVSSALWVVDPEKSNRLVPQGCIGEMLIQGPLLARGYVSADKKAIQNWVTESHRLPLGIPCEKSYLTGDLVRRHPDGSFEFIGRKDSQVKIHGQRTEIGEIETRLSEFLPQDMRGFVDIMPGKDASLDAVAAFIWYTEGLFLERSPVQLLDRISDDTRHTISDIDTQLRALLPPYMVPTSYLIFQGKPKQTHSGKIDRRQLLEMGSAASPSQKRLFSPQAIETRPATTNMELRLRDLWSQILQISPDDIGKEDDFFRLGGDSVSAIRLVAESHQRAIVISVADIFENPGLGAMALVASTDSASIPSDAIPFSMLPEEMSIETAVTQTRIACGLSVSQEVTDIYPCSALQEGLMAIGAKKPGSYVARNVYRIPDATNITLFQTAWETTMRLCEILRTRIFFIKEGVAAQAVIKDDIEWEATTTTDITTAIDSWKGVDMSYGTRLCRYAIIESDGARHFLLIMHHALYDGWTLRTIFDVFEQAYHALTPRPLRMFRNFIYHTSNIDKRSASEYWINQLQGVKRTTFPIPSYKRMATETSGNYTATIPLSRQTNTSITKASILCTAWATILARYCDTDDVCFGMTVSGRHAAIARVNDVAGPMIATVPMRVQKGKFTRVWELLERVQSQSVEMIPYEQYGLQNIAKLGPDAEAACDFQSLLVIQPADIIETNQESSQRILVTGELEKALTQESLNDYFDYPLVLQGVVREETVELLFTYDGRIITSFQCAALSEQLRHVVHQLTSQTDELVDSLSVAGPWDLGQAIEWNRQERLESEECIHDLVAQTAGRQPDREAIYSADGSLTYAELQHHVDKLAQYLIKLDIPQNSIIPLCFERSKWAIVAMLGILKAGCAFMPLDPAHPRKRKESLVAEVEASIVVASSFSLASCEGLSDHTVEVCERFLASITPSENKRGGVTSRSSSPEDRAYVLFTSGSTGRPKGVVTEHSAICTSMRGWAQKHGVQQSSRVLQFSSYAFDACSYEIFMTLIFGGTVCVPSDEERLGGLSAFMRSGRVTTALLTPSFVRTLEPSQLPDLETLVLIGEAPSMDIVRKWKSPVRLLNGYGPTECCTICNSHEFGSDDELLSSKTIGSAVHGNLWVVDPENHERLAPIGCPGELLIHSHALARGYYNDPDKTQDFFLEDAGWLPRSLASQSKRLYKTGDLVRYNYDGRLEYIGRKDTQVKLRGQRLELSEIEYGIQVSTGKIRNVAVALSGRDSGDFLVAFLEFVDSTELSSVAHTDLRHDILPLVDETRAVTGEICEYLRSTLPLYMIPSFFIPMRRIPFVTSMKKDSKGLQDLANDLSLETLAQYALGAQEKTSPVTENERTLRSFWSEILGIAPEEIGRHDGFLHIGGDSISAIQLSALARKNGYDLPVPLIFKDSRLSAMGDAMTMMDAEHDYALPGPAPFSLLKTDNVDETVAQLRQHCKLADSEIIQDAYPCTPLQEGLLALGVKHRGSYVAKHVYRLNNDTDIDRFKASWEYVYNICDNQRQRIVKLGGNSIQVLVGGDFEWEPTDKISLREFLDIAQNMNMSYGAKLCRSAIIHESTGETYFVWVNHHAVFDGWAITLILSALRDAYEGAEITPFSPYASFIQYSSNIDMVQAREYWKDQLHDGRPAEFPPLKPLASSPGADANEKVTRLISRKLPFPARTNSSITKGTILRAAWALVLARYGSTDDVCFGATASGRNAPVPGVERMAGTVIGTVPVRIRIDPKKPTFGFLEQVQAQALEMIRFEQTGFQNIAKISPELKRASEVSSLLIVQPERQVDVMLHAASSIMDQASEEEYSVGDTMEGYFTFPIVIQCPIFNDHALVHFTYDSSIVTPSQMEALCHHFETVVNHLLVQDDTPVGEISLSGSWDLEQAIYHNRGVKESSVHACIHDLISQWATEKPEGEAVYSTDIRFTYQELDDFSNKLAQHLLRIGVGFETVVPICFEKSAWTIVAMLGIMKAGGVFMPMDPSHPTERRQSLINQVGAKYLVASLEAAASCHNFVQNLVTVSPSFFDEMDDLGSRNHQLPQPSPSNAAYILFTSGSTGQPKGISVEHTAICSSILSHGNEFALNQSSRVLQFASYVFDVSISEILTTLVFGGTVCVPSAAERMQDIATFINNSKADTAMLTPSFVTTFTPDQVPDLKVLILGGEAPTKETLRKWQPHVRLLNGYAPAECCIYALTHDYHSVEENPTILGKGLHSNCWIVEPNNHNLLAPNGCVGELVIQGNVIGRGYVGDEKRTAEAFLDSVDWLPSSLKKPNDRFYKSGDLVKYDDNGDIEYLGRKDTQVKLRGQRIELGEIEFNVKAAMADAQYVAVEVIRRSSRETLVVFVSFSSDEDQDPRNAEDQRALILPRTKSLQRQFENLSHKLEATLPPYMVPSLFVAVQEMPFLSSMKVDRRSLRSLVENLPPEEFSKLSLSTKQNRAPTSELQFKLRDLWASVLMMDADRIGINDNFFQVGGDSLAAIQLSNLSQREGICISVAKIFEDSTLATMAEDAGALSSQQNSDTAPFSLLHPESLAKILETAKAQCGVAEEDVEDIYPCTNLQEGMLSLSSRQSGAYISTTMYRLTPGLDIKRFKSAWEYTVAKCSNLRTRAIEYKSEGNWRMMQVVTRSSPGWTQPTGYDPLKSFGDNVHNKAMDHGSPLCRYILVEGEHPYFLLTMHHAIYDLWTQKIILSVLESAYHDTAQVPLRPFANFVNYNLSLTNEKSREYWGKELKDVQRTPYPRPAAVESAAKGTMTSFEATISFPETTRTHITQATVLRAAWALVLARYCETDDVCFGTTVSGRLASLPGLADMVGPTIAAIPIRMRLDRQTTVEEFLENVQVQSSNMISHEQFGLHNIAKTTPEARAACDFSSLLVIQPLQHISSMTSSAHRVMEEVKDSEAEHNDLQDYFSYPLVVNCLTSDTDAKLLIYYDSERLSPIELVALEHHMNRVVQLLLVHEDWPLSSISLIDNWDMNLALEQQPVADVRGDRICCHTAITENAAKTPYDVAISSSDGDVTYQDLVTLSQRLAMQLVTMGVSPGSLVPLCLTKSKWAIVSALGIQLAGGIVVPCDPTSLQAMDSVAIEMGVKFILTTMSSNGILDNTNATIFEVGADSLPVIVDGERFHIPEISPGDPGFITFTAGNQDISKGSMTSHRALYSATTMFGSILKLQSTSRVLQSSSLRHFMGVIEVFGTLIHGGCVCIPAEGVLAGSSLTKAINYSRADTVFLLPSLADTIEPDQVPSLRSLAFGGEPISQRSVAHWSSLGTVHSFYGSAETLLCATSDLKQTPPSSLGQALSSNLWVVEKADETQLVPVGCVGELVVEGPHVAQAYIDKASPGSDFIEDLAFLPGKSIRRGFKTGDLVRRNYDGTFDFVGRKDRDTSPSKSRPTEHDQAELYLKELLPENMTGIMALTQAQPGMGQKLEALLWYRNSCDESFSRRDPSNIPAGFDALIVRLDSSLTRTFPAYARPSSYMLFEGRPGHLPSGKINRREVVTLANTVPFEERCRVNPQGNQKDPPTTATELKLREMWATVLGIPAAEIGKRDNFLNIGGDSISAIQLVALARHNGLGLDVASIFKDPRLSEVAATAVLIEGDTTQVVEAFSLLKSAPSDYTLHEIRQQCALRKNDTVEDLYPCTPLQEGLLALGVKNSASYVARYVLQLGENIDTGRFKRAWEHVVDMSADMRTRILLLDGKCMQAVIKEQIEWEEVQDVDIESYIKNTEQAKMGYGAPLSRYALIAGRYLVWTVHHAISDGWTTQVILDRLSKTYNRLEAPKVGSFANFIKKSMEIDQAAAQDYWRRELNGAKRASFPPGTIQGRNYIATYKRTMSFEKPSDTSITTATILRAAWAVVIAKYCDTNDVCFGTTVSGRQAALSGVENISGPMIATVPIRIKLDRDLDVPTYLSQVQDQATDMVQFEQYGLQNIAKVSSFASEACDFASLIAIQPTRFASTGEDGNKNEVLDFIDMTKYGANDVTNGYYNYPLVVQLRVSPEDVEFDIVYSSNLLSEYRIEALTNQFENVAKQLLNGKYSKLHQVSVSGEWDLQQAIHWNQEDLTSVNACVHDFFSTQVAEVPEKEALYSTERSLTYAEFDQLSSQLARHLRTVGVGLETVVPFCFEKSIWAVVSVFAILKAGGAFMPMDPTHPFTYRQGLVKQVGAKVILVSQQTSSQCEDLAEHIVSVSSSLPCFSNENVHLEDTTYQKPGPSNAAYVLFSSGSTGVPKGIVVEHSAFSASLTGHGERFGFTRESRVLQFSNFVFDVSVSEMITTLAWGGTLCVPTDTERLQGTSQFIEESRCNMATMTPSFIKTLTPDQVPTLQKLLAGGEAVTSDLLETWAESKTFINAYGPAEASVYSVTHQYKSSKEIAATIGRGVNNSTWVVNPEDHSQLSPIGCVGELVLQGPAIARGYVNDPKRTAASFSVSLDCLPEDIVSQSPRFYRTGDLVQYHKPGELVYMGRSDAQVKLRGQRIELGDIEYKIKKSESAVEYAIVDIMRQRSSEALVAFVSFTKEDPNDHAPSPDEEKRESRAATASMLPIDTETMRNYFRDMSAQLATVLPRHMIPTYYIPMETMPQTSSGKIDRKSLRESAHALSTEELLSYAAAQRSPYRDCTNETEKQVRKLWARTLDIEEETISIDDNFYDLGGDSIRIVTLVKYLQKEFDVLLGLSMLNSRNTTIAVMSNLIESRAPKITQVDLMAEIVSISGSPWVRTLDRTSFRSSTATPSQATVFLTGATGFLGTQLLRQLLESRDVKRVITLVRAVTTRQGLDKLRRTAHIAGWWREEHKERIEIWIGDLESPHLGLKDRQWEQICGKSTSENVNAIIHNGAVVNWNADYDKLRRPNVQSTRELLQAAVESRESPKLVFVSGGAKTDMDEDISQTAEKLSNNIGYSQTKFVAEATLHKISSRLPPNQNRLSTVKPGIIIGTADEGVANVDDFIWRIVATAVQMNLFPLDSTNDWVAISDAASVATSILDQLYSDKIESFVDLARGMRSADFWAVINSELRNPCKPIPWNTWAEKAIQHMNFVGEKHPLWPVQHFLGNFYLPRPKTPTDGGEALLRAAVKKNVQYLTRIGFIRSGKGDRGDEEVVEDVIRRSNTARVMH